MKKNITLFIVLAFFSCKEKKAKKEFSSYIKVTPSFYNIIFKEIEQIDTSRYYITHQIIKNIDKINEFQDILNNQKPQNNYKILNIKSNLNLPKSTKEIITKSLTNKEKKIELNYSFSYPYLLKDSTILIFNELNYIASKKNIIGGGTRVFFLKKNNKKWEIEKTTTLVDY